MGMYKEIEILVLISHLYLTVMQLKPHCVIRCLCLCRYSPWKDDVHPIWWPVVAKRPLARAIGASKLILVTLIFVDSH